MGRKQGLFIGTDGEIREVAVDVNKNGLRDYYRLIETDIVERVTLKAFGYSVEVWCDEEGLLKRSLYNSIAHDILDYPIVGNVVLHSRSLDKVIAGVKEVGYQLAEGG